MAAYHDVQCIPHDILHASIAEPLQPQVQFYVDAAIAILFYFYLQSTKRIVVNVTKHLYSTCQLNIFNAWACEEQVKMPHSIQISRIHLYSKCLYVLRVLFRNPTQTNHLCKYAYTTSWAIRCKLQEFTFNFDNHSRLWLNKNELVLRGGKEVTHQKGADPEIHCKHTRRLEDGDGFPHNSRSA